jgi:hypothetical protein
MQTVHLKSFAHDRAFCGRTTTRFVGLIVLPIADFFLSSDKHKQCGLCLCRLAERGRAIHALRLLIHEQHRQQSVTAQT